MVYIEEIHIASEKRASFFKGRLRLWHIRIIIVCSRLWEKLPSSWWYFSNIFKKIQLTNNRVKVISQDPLWKTQSVRKPSSKISFDFDSSDHNLW